MGWGVFYRAGQALCTGVQLNAPSGQACLGLVLLTALSFVSFD